MIMLYLCTEGVTVDRADGTKYFNNHCLTALYIKCFFEELCISSDFMLLLWL